MPALLVAAGRHCGQTYSGWRSAVLAAGFVLLATAAGLAAANDVAAVDACNADAFQTVLQPASVSHEARAVWLNRRLAKWPGASADGQFRLYYSASARLDVRVGGKVSGADGALPLNVFSETLPAALRQRFKFVADGVVLSLGEAGLAQIAGLHQQQTVLVQESADGEVLKFTGMQIASALDDLYASANKLADLGVSVGAKHSGFTLWAPTA
jgi:hypothetical protein